ncbi:TetR/AcrR family transcriptional regulator [Thermodesulfovibrio hydrogeniphilus]
MLVITDMKTTKDRILESALKLFSQKGYLGTTTKEIAKEANVAEVTLFRYFTSKENLFIEVIKSQSFLPTLKDLIPKLKEMDYYKALETTAKYYVKLLKKKQNLIHIMLSEMFKYPEEIREIHNKIIQEVHRVFAEYLDYLKTSGNVKNDINSVYASSAYFGMLFSIFLKKELFKKAVNLNEAIHTCVKIFYEGTKKREFE